MVTMNGPHARDWTPVTAADGAVLGWMQAVEPDDAEPDYFEEDRLALVRRRADAIDPVAALFDSAFTEDEIREMWAASGLSQDDLDSAGNVALILWRIEQQDE
jgi:hypothetical protein